MANSERSGFDRDLVCANPLKDGRCVFFAHAPQHGLTGFGVVGPLHRRVDARQPIEGGVCVDSVGEDDRDRELR